MNAPTDWLITTAGQGAAGMLVWSWQALALLAVVWLALKILRMKSPTLRHQVWMFGLVAVATLPLSSLGIQRFPSLRPSGPALNYVVEAPQAVIDFASQPPVQTSPEIAPEKAATASPVKVAAKTPTARHLLFPSLLAALFVAWMIGALITLPRLMKNHLGVRGVLKRANPSALLIWIAGNSRPL